MIIETQWHLFACHQKNKTKKQSEQRAVRAGAGSVSEIEVVTVKREVDKFDLNDSIALVVSQISNIGPWRTAFSYFYYFTLRAFSGPTAIAALSGFSSTAFWN